MSESALAMFTHCGADSEVVLSACILPSLVEAPPLGLLHIALYLYCQILANRPRLKAR